MDSVESTIYDDDRDGPEPDGQLLLEIIRKEEDRDLRQLVSTFPSNSIRFEFDLEDWFRSNASAIRVSNIWTRQAHRNPEPGTSRKTGLLLISSTTSSQNRCSSASFQQMANSDSIRASLATSICRNPPVSSSRRITADQTSRWFAPANMNRPFTRAVWHAERPICHAI